MEEFDPLLFGLYEFPDAITELSLGFGKLLPVEPLQGPELSVA